MTNGARLAKDRYTGNCRTPINSKTTTMAATPIQRTLDRVSRIHIQAASTAVSKGELDMAKTLIERMTDKWQPEKYKDDYKSSLMELIEKKIASGGRTPRSAAAKSRPTTNVIDLMDVLRESLAKPRKPRNRPPPPSRPSAKRRKAA